LKVTPPFDRFIKSTFIGAWIDAINPRPLYFVVTTRSESAVSGRFDSNIRIFSQATLQFFGGSGIDALINASLAYVPSMGNVPVSFEFATIIVC
jgi:hypothetical protein